MLRHTFIHLPGVGPHRERTLWGQGILDWKRFLEAVESRLLRQRIYESAVPLVHQSLDAVTAGDPSFFHGRLPSGETWRLYPEFAGRALFLDIETTGLSPDYNEVTVIGALEGGNLGKPALFVKGINLDQFPAYVARFPLLITFNGSLFDVPFLRAHFPTARLDQAQIDLRFALRPLGYRGGLKAIERNLGLTRDAAIQGVDGFEAVRLWHCYRRGDREALRKLILYNLTDVVNLVELMETTIKLKHPQLAFPGETMAVEPPPARKFDAGSLGPWIEQTLSSWGRA
jgi:uncharacterized protein YprB with RNaseH-like and TPR domain